jgi:hypothetical protein
MNSLSECGRRSITPEVCTSRPSQPLSRETKAVTHVGRLRLHQAISPPPAFVLFVSSRLFTSCRFSLETSLKRFKPFQETLETLALEINHLRGFALETIKKSFMKRSARLCAQKEGCPLASKPCHNSAPTIAVLRKSREVTEKKVEFSSQTEKFLRLSITYTNFSVRNSTISHILPMKIPCACSQWLSLLFFICGSAIIGANDTNSTARSGGSGFDGTIPLTMAEVLAKSKPSDWRQLDPENTLYPWK